MTTPATPQPSLLRRAVSGVLAFFRETALVLLIALVIATGVRLFVAQAFVIPSESMLETLHVEDRIIVGKMGFQPSDLHRGDIVVFSDPDHWLAPQPAATDGGLGAVFRDTLEFVGLVPRSGPGHLVKRVIGIPGDVMTCTNDAKMRVNGVTLDESAVIVGEFACDTPFTTTLGAGQYWVMGDNRQNSEDSRVHGPVPAEAITGRVLAVVWPVARWQTIEHPSVYTTIPDAPAAQ